MPVLVRKQLALFFFALFILLAPCGNAAAQPPYAKWGRIAIEQTVKRYPHAQVVDYLHVGRKNKTATTSEETFKLLLREGNRVRAVFVRIEFTKESEEVVAVRFEES